MGDEIKVYVVEFGDRRHYQLQWRDPDTGRLKTKSSKVLRTGRKRERDAAIGAAAKLEADLREGRYASPSKITWAEFRDRYEDEHLASLAEDTQGKVSAVFNTVERILSPDRLMGLTAARLSYYQKVLRDEGRSENTIAGYLSHLAAALRWALRMGFLVKLPAIEKPHRAKDSEVMKGRPITGEEFERMLDKAAAGLLLRAKQTTKRKPEPKPGEEPKPKRTWKNKQGPKEPEPAAVEAWRHYLRGLWLSGLRLGESLELSWDDGAGLCVDLVGKFPMLRIRAESEKGNKDRLLPITPDFAEFLAATPEARRTGLVFKLREGRQLDAQYVSAVVSAIGEAATVKVNTDPRTGKVKYASAHDLRRSFGQRWASRVMPQVLRELMRHESIETTMRYYVGRNAETTARAIWEAFANIPSNSGPAERKSGTPGDSRSAASESSWVELPGKDSNLERGNQNPLCYHYTTG